MERSRLGQVVLPATVVLVVAVMILPLPASVLDILIVANLSTAIIILLVSMNVRRALDFSSFPSLLLVVTLLRLGLNVATSRAVLSDGHAGEVIATFGSIVVGGSIIVGMVIFLILTLVQFVVISNGSGRVAEVTARFTLDAMPGKQMAIDADLSAGVIGEDEARTRRKEVGDEADFYGAMDGASKFVRGDAIAGLIITALNLVGGIALGSFAGMEVAEAVDKYSKLSIGDGLVSQIPALFVSTAAAVLVTKSNSERTLGTNLFAQVGGRPKATLIAAGMLFVVGLLPGLPPLPFWVLATVLVLMWRATRGKEGAEELFAAPSTAKIPAAVGEPGAKEEQKVEELLAVDRVSLEIGFKLIPLVQDKGGAGILDHVQQLRKRFALKEGIVLPPVRIKDNIRLAPNGYRVLVGGHEVAHGEIEPGQFLAMDGGGASGKVRGKETRDPAFGLPAWWIAESARDEAEVRGYTVVDPTSVLVTHLAETLRAQIGEILTRDDVKEMVDAVKKNSPAVVDELVPSKMSYGDVQRVLRGLLREGVSVRNLPAILEACADNAGKTKDTEQMVELVRMRLARALVESHADRDGVVHAVTLDPDIENKLAAAVNGGGPEGAAVNPAWLQKLMERTAAAVATSTKGGKDVVILARSNVRRFLTELARSSLPKVAVLSYNEVAPARSIQTTAIVRMED